ncbi:MAG: sugar kinase [Clostridia bacterium]|nr:sugar kinase [Clostridia bacterium]
MKPSDEKKSFEVLGLGEVMLRLSPVGKERVSYCETFEKMAGGSELNVVAGISMLGMRTGMITKLPRNDIGKFIKHKIRYTGTSDDYIIYDDSEEKRLGVYYYESGAYPRLPVVSYDRKGSSFTTFRHSELPEDIYTSTHIFHTSGITLALDEGVCQSAMEMMHKFYKAGALISFDVNYRASLWSEEKARETITSLLPMIDILFVSEETLRRMFGMKGELTEIHREFAKKYSSLKVIASTKRTVISSQKHTFTSLIYDCKEDRHFGDAPYENIDVIDRIGSGDAYVAGALYGLRRFGTIEAAAEYGDAMAAVKNTVIGDMTECDLADIERVIKNHKETGPKSEMIR